MRIRLIGAIALLPLCASCAGFGFSPRDQAVETINMERYFNERLAAGRLHLREGSPTKAIEAFRQASYDPDSKAEAYNGMGVAYSLMGRDDVARSLFLKAIEQDPSDERFRRNLARLDTQVMLAAQDVSARTAEGVVRANDAIAMLPTEGSASVATNLPKARTRIVEVFVGTRPAQPSETPVARSSERLAGHGGSVEVGSQRRRVGQSHVRIELTKTSKPAAASTAVAVRPSANSAAVAPPAQPITRFPLRVDLDQPRTIASAARVPVGQTFPMKIDLLKQ